MKLISIIIKNSNRPKQTANSQQQHHHQQRQQPQTQQKQQQLQQQEPTPNDPADETAVIIGWFSWTVTEQPRQ